MRFLYVGAFLSPPHDHMNRNLIVHFDCWSGNIVSFLGLLSTLIFIFGAFVLWSFCSSGLYSVPPRDHMNRMGIVHTCIT